VSLLGGLLLEPRDRRSPVALRWDASSNLDQTVAWGEFVVDVARLRDELSRQSTGGWVLLTEDAYSFAVGLLALWHSGRHAISPPNRQSGALRNPQTGAAGILTDRPDWFGEASTLHPLLDGERVDVERELSEATKSFRRLDEDALAVEFFTSGTTGDEKPILKQLRHLATEVEELGRNWDDRVDGSVLFSSASHQHLYGMLFGVLWPLCSSHVFRAEHYLHAGELLPRLAAAEGSVLASVPTHLKRLALHAQAPQLRDRCALVFSSGGPLPEETAHAIAGLVGDAPIEVFGSTETGGIAWRCQSPPAKGEATVASPSLWTPFAGVEVAADSSTGTLRVRSPFVSFGEAASGRRKGQDSEFFTTGDRVAIRGAGQFELLGRMDRVVKIGERRLDLTRMESELRGETWVAEVGLTTLRRETDDPAGERGDAQERVAAVVAPSESGWVLIGESGRRALSARLRARLGESWDPVLHPRYWRFVAELPENAQGKVTQSLLRETFQEADWGRMRVDRPEMLGETREENAIERIALVPSDLECFPGHFPNRFVVPGVLQLDWALGLAEVLLGRAPEVERIESLKMLMPLDPGARFRIRVERARPDRLDLKLWFGDRIFSKGRVRIATSIGSQPTLQPTPEPTLLPASQNGKAEAVDS
jgi:acyl-coenzyme A synthetase/AMP-(fatty) acid ligase/3-hydroxymyristoyl/3-hydroxydecanoyl-(acyl carrier protein) dehydratase